jgi:hypothetical protein
VASAAAEEAARIVEALVGRGITQKTIGAAIGRNDSLISQIRRRTGKGASLRDRLAELLATAEEHDLGRGATPEQLAAGGQEPARRTRKTGTMAKVRRAVSTRYGGGGSTSTIKAQAAASGGNGLWLELQRAYRDGLSVAFDATFWGRKVTIHESSGRPATRHRKTWTVTINPNTGRAHDTCLRLGSVTDGVLTMMMEDGLISFNSLQEARSDLISIEMRVW